MQGRRRTYGTEVEGRGDAGAAGGGVEAAWRRPKAEARGGGRQPDGVSSSAIREPGGASVGLLGLGKNGQVPRCIGALF